MQEVIGWVVLAVALIYVGMLVVGLVKIAASVVAYLRGERYIGWGHREKRIDKR